MITREQVKAEIDDLRDEYVDLVYRIIKSLEPPAAGVSGESGITGNRAAWQFFIEQTYGSLAGTPTSRGDQGSYEIREEVQRFIF